MQIVVADALKQSFVIEQGRAIQLPAVVGNQPPHQAEAVGVHAGAGEAENDVSGFDRVAGQRLRALDGADAEAGEVVIALGIHARHLRRLAADERTAGLPATVGNRSDDRLCDGRIELPGREIVEEEERLGALDDEIVGAHRDEVDADAGMIARIDGELELGADSVIGRDQ